NIFGTLEKVRIFGVLQRIACAYFIGIFICLLLKSTKKIATAGIALMFIFWGILFAYNPDKPYDKKENACRAVDLIIPGETHTYKGYSRTLDVENFNFSVVDETHFKVQPADNTNIDLKYTSFASVADYKLDKNIHDNYILYTVTPRENITTENAVAKSITQLKAATETLAFDPEGLLGAMSAAATVIFGFLIGRLINFYSENKEKLCLHLLLLGTFSTFVGMFWGQWFIISKPLWTGSYVLYAGGLAMIILAFFIWLMDVKCCNQKYFRPLIAFGSNPLFLFVMSGVIAKTMAFAYFDIENTSLKGWIYNNIYKGIINPTFGSMLYAITFIIVMWILAEILYRKKIYIKV
ncbi:MAG: hypothetical protein LBT56_03575, partial [Prevotellaceae bacterium]|nr:hypothetical protein [Prevotellaceae bacterium]